jgi:hypothetical protein
MRGAPHKGFSALIRRINARSSASIFGRPPSERPRRRRAAEQRQRKVSNGVAGLAGAGSSLDRQKSRQFLPISRMPAEMALGPSCVSLTQQLKRE